MSAAGVGGHTDRGVDESAKRLSGEREIERESTRVSVRGRQIQTDSGAFFSRFQVRSSSLKAACRYLMR